MSFREEIIGDCRLILGDCREVLPTLSVDHIISDPPYSDNTHKMAKTNKGSGHGKKLVTFDALSGEQFDDVVSAFIAAAKGWVVLTCDYKHAARFYDAPQFIRLGAWVKPNPMPQISADRPGQGFETVLILHSGVMAKAWNRGGASGVWTTPVMNGAEVPTQKPLALVRAFVTDFTAMGDLVADPFMGSGTTGVACVRTGRRFVGIEAKAEHFDIACKRISEAYRQPDMFVERPTAPKQEALL
jgi:site-specific DNA-methyltransferase (adenine-specific)